MNIENINYLDYGENKKGTIVLMHGWGQNIQMMDMLGKPFEKEYRIINIDLPGFGSSPEPDHSLSIQEYGDLINKLLKHLKVNDPIMIGHSFGGRIAIYYASKYQVNKLILLSAPFRPNQNKQVSFKVKIYKAVKKVKFLSPFANYMKKRIGSSDYKNASEVNRGTLVKAVNTDLTECAKKIVSPTILIYGTNDTAVDITEAEVLEKLIKDAGLIKYEGNTHYAYLERIKQTISIIEVFIR